MSQEHSTDAKMNLLWHKCKAKYAWDIWVKKIQPAPRWIHNDKSSGEHVYKMCELGKPNYGGDVEENMLEVCEYEKLDLH